MAQPGAMVWRQVPRSASRASLMAHATPMCLAALCTLLLATHVAAAMSPCEAAVRTLRVADRTALCAGAGDGVGPAQCWTAVRGTSSMTRAQKLDLCSHSRSSTPAACYAAAPTFMSSDDRVSLCKVRQMACVRVRGGWCGRSD